MSDSKQQSLSAATDVPEFISDLDGGQFERAVSVALSECAAAAVDHKKAAKVVIEFELKPIAGTHQVHTEHTIKFTRPTEAGKRSEEFTRSTPMHVGKYGKLSLVAEAPTDVFGTAPTTA